MPDQPKSPWLPTEPASSEAARDSAATPELEPVATSPASAWAPGAAAGPIATERRKLLIPVWLVALGVIALVSATIACVVLATDDDKPGSVSAAPGGPPGSIRLRTVRDPFVLDGVRWAVFAAPAQNWTLFSRRVQPGPGKRWLPVAVRVRNLSRDSFVPNVLTYRLVDDDGSEYVTDPVHSTAGVVGSTVPENGLAQVQLAFRVPETASGLTLRYATRVSGGIAVGVPVGGS